MLVQSVQPPAQHVVLPPSATMAKAMNGGSESGVAATLQPPAELKGIIDKTAQFVARNGPEFESRILKNEQNNVKFSFLQQKDPFNAYYKAKVVELGGKPAGSETALAAAPTSSSAEVSAQPTAKRAPTIAPLEPPKPNYIVPRPVGAQPLDLDVIQLTAQYVARNGRSFLTGIANREAKNPQFDFLKPTHYLFPFFTSMVDAYSKCLAPAEELRSRLSKDAADPMRVLRRVQQYGAHYSKSERDKASKQSQEEAERRANLLIDWHDFVVVETIGFDDEDDALPAPQDLSATVGARNEAAAAQKDKEKAEREEEAAATQRRAEAAQAAEAEQAEIAEKEKIEKEQAERAEKAEKAAAQQAAPVAQQAEEAEVEALAVPDARLIRKDYTPQVGTRTQSSVHFAVDPITRQQVRLDELEEHMRISLLDPKWKEQKQLEAERRKDSNVAGDDDINRNLKSFAARRTDIFGDKEVAIGET
eukprot:6086768-Pleurochrysis_carterae.AAC.2